MKFLWLNGSVRFCVFGSCLAIGYSSAVLAAPNKISLEQAVLLAQQNDPWLKGSEYRQEATLAESVAAGQLPDPKVSLGLANLPVDSLDFGQEPMTQLKVGITQVFPRGSSRKLKQRQLQEQSEQQPLMRRDRKAKVAVTVAQLWLDIFRERESIKLIENDRMLFENLVDVAQSSYSNAYGKTRQQDLIRAQLELTRLDNRLSILHQRYDSSYVRLQEWMISASTGQLIDFELETALPALTLNNLDWMGDSNKKRAFQQILLLHPSIKSLDQKIAANDTGITLAKQQYKPQWDFNANYGYRDNNPLGDSRSDFFSVALTFDLPLFASKRQDKTVRAAIANTEAYKTEKALVLRAMQARLEAALANLQGLNERSVIYQTRLLKEIHEQAEASLTAYTNDTGDFSEVVRARIDELNAQIDSLDIDVERLKTIAQVNYFLVPSDAPPTLRTEGFQP
ncbi:MAG: outer membrane protein TolC [Lentisphaeria bacterium]|jgi:outer membrane protein TolC